MPNYLARVVLHRLNSKGNDSSEDYSDFHAQMDKIGFEPAIEGVNTTTNQRVRHALPGGLFYFDGERTVNQNRFHTLQEIYNAVYGAVDEVVRDESKYIRDANKPHSIFVAETGSCQWDGLPQVPPRTRKAIFP